MQIQQAIKTSARAHGPTAPRLYCPFQSRISPHANQVEADNLAWLTRLGFVPTRAAATRLQRASFGRLAARAYPDASPEGLGIAAGWATWLSLRDDLCDERGIASDPEAMCKLADEHVSILAGLRSLPGDGPLTRALAELRERMIARGGVRCIARFLGNVQDYFEASVWEADNRRHDRVPDLRTYLRLRDLAGAVRTGFDVYELVQGPGLSIAARHDPTLVRMMQLANRAICWSDDVFSIERQLMQGDFHNLVAVLQHDAGLPPRDAIAEAVHMHDDAIGAFECRELRLIEHGMSPEVGCFVAALKGWMRANLDWSIETGRYAPA